MFCRLSAACSVLLVFAMGAFGAHGLKKYVTDPDLLESWKTAAWYQLIHAVMVGVAAALRRGGSAPKLFYCRLPLF